MDARKLARRLIYQHQNSPSGTEKAMLDIPLIWPHLFSFSLQPVIIAMSESKHLVAPTLLRVFNKPHARPPVQLTRRGTETGPSQGRLHRKSTQFKAVSMTIIFPSSSSLPSFPESFRFSRNGMRLVGLDGEGLWIQTLRSSYLL